MAAPLNQWPRGPHPEREAAREERTMAAVGYLLWPLALPALLNSGDVERSSWLRGHARQAVTLGICSWSLLGAVFALPLVLLLIGFVPFTATLGLYEFAFFIDMICAGIAFGFGVAAARRAARGDQFALRELLPIAKKDLM